MLGFLFGDRSQQQRSSVSGAFFRGLSLRRNSRFPGNRDGFDRDAVRLALERRPEAKDSPLARPFGRQIGEASNAHAVWERAVDSGFDEVGSEEGK